VKITEGLTFVSALGAITVASFAYVAATHLKVVVIPLSSKIGNSPIMASGGSMTFRANTTTWNCDTVAGQPYHTKCVTAAQVPVGTIAWDNVITNTSLRTLGWTGLTTPWYLDIYARNTSGTVVAPAQAGGVRMCTASTNVIANATCSGTGYILIMVKGTSVVANGKLGLMDGSVNDSSAAKQYFDSGCIVHTVLANNTLPGCEHPGNIVSSIDGLTYKCQDGSCQISIDR